MNDNNVTNAEPTTMDPETKKKSLNPIVKKVLIWGGVAAGIAVAFFLMKPSDEDQDYIIVEETVEPDGTTTTTTVAAITD